MRETAKEALRSRPWMRPELTSEGNWTRCANNSQGSIFVLSPAMGRAMLELLRDGFYGAWSGRIERFAWMRLPCYVCGGKNDGSLIEASLDAKKTQGDQEGLASA